MMSRREILLPIAASVVVPPVASGSHSVVMTPPPPPPDHYDIPLGIGLETWPYPAPVRWMQCTAGGQSLRMAYMDIPPTGPPRNRAIVLLHGKNFDSSYWAGPILDLAAAGYRVIVPDQIGFNKSSKPDLTYTFDMLAALTVNLLGSLQISRAAILGHSTGGMLAVRLAAAYPDRVERLILEDPVGLVDYRRFIPPQTLDTLVLAERRRTATNYRAFMRTFFPILPAKDLEPFVEWRMRVALSGEYERFCQASALTYQMIYIEPVRDEYQDIKAPTLMIVGEKDQSAPLKHYASPEMAAKMPTIPVAALQAVQDLHDGRLVSVPNVGHVPHLEAPETFRKAMMAFLGT